MNNYKAPAFEIEAVNEADIIRTSGGEIDLPEMPAGDRTQSVEDL